MSLNAKVRYSAYTKAQEILLHASGCGQIFDISRAFNKEVNELAKTAAQKHPLPQDVFFETLKYNPVNNDEAPVKFVNTITSKD